MSMPSPEANSLQSLLDTAKPATLGVALVMIEDALRMGHVEVLTALIRDARARWGEDPGLDLAEVKVFARLGEVELARERLARLRSRNPEDAVAEMYEALLKIERKDFVAARQCLRAMVRRCPDYPGVAGTLASLLMPGPNYREVLAALHDRLRPRGYLEIGVETGATLALARAERVIGIDPNLAPLRRERLVPHAELYETTSEQFFAVHQPGEIFGAVPVDMVFIDGLHRFEAALRDFLAVERWAHAGTVVVMHDALPVAPVYAEPERRTRFWVGDVWKAIYVLCRCRLDLRIRIIPTAPSGLVVVRLCSTARSETSAVSSLGVDLTLPTLRDEDPVWPIEFPLVTNDARGYAEALGQ